MTHWLLRAAAVTTGWAANAAAQPLSPAALANGRTTPAAAVRAAAPEEAAVVLLMRTAGQPDRTLKVLKRSTFPDGDALVDVQDVTTGQRFTLPAKLADRLPRGGATAAVASAAPPPPRMYPPPPVPQPPRTFAPPLRPAVAVAPVAQPAYVPQPQPTPAPAPAVTTASAPPVAPTPVLIPAVKLEWKAIAPAPPAPVPVAAPPVAMPATPALNPVPSDALQPAGVPTPPLNPFAPPLRPADRWKPIRTAPPAATPPTEGGLVIRGQMPASLGGRPTAFTKPGGFASRGRPPADALGTLPLVGVPSPVHARPVVELPPPPTARLPQSVSAVPVPALPSFELPRAPVAVAPLPAMPTQPAEPGYARLTVPSPVESPPPPSPTFADTRPASWTRTSPTVVMERTVAEENLRRVVMHELRPLEEEMATALRPSVRMTAARNLADMRYAARPEVKAVLARSAMTDPSAAVRAACVRALAQLGYADAEYVTYLQATADGDAPDTLRLAAAESLRRLRPR